MNILNLPEVTMNNIDEQGQGREQQMSGEGETKGSGHRGDQGQQSHDTSRLERDGHEFPRTGESAQNSGEQQMNDSSSSGNTGQNQARSELGVGQAAGSTQTVGSGRDRSENTGDGRRDPVGSTYPAESHDSWRPSADPAAGDMAAGDERDDQTP